MTLDTSEPAPDANALDANALDANALDANTLDASRADSGSDVGAQDAGEPEPTPGSTFFDARARSVTSLCACPTIAADFDSLQSCVGLRSESPLVRSCFVDAASSLPSTNTVLSCLAENEDSFGVCVDAASCVDAAVNECIRTSFEGIQACGLDPAVFLPLAEAQAECLVGPAGMCPESPPSSATGDAVFVGDNFRAGNDRPYAAADCHSDGPDRSHAWTAPSSGEWVIDGVGSDFPAILAVYDDCASDVAVACSPSAPIREPAVVSVTLEAGQTVIIVVDGFNGTAVGNYVVNIRPR